MVAQSLTPASRCLRTLANFPHGQWNCRLWASCSNSWTSSQRAEITKRQWFINCLHLHWSKTYKMMTSESLCWGLSPMYLNSTRQSRWVFLWSRCSGLCSNRTRDLNRMSLITPFSKRFQSIQSSHSPLSPCKSWINLPRWLWMTLYGHQVLKFHCSF